MAKCPQCEKLVGYVVKKRQAAAGTTKQATIVQCAYCSTAISIFPDELVDQIAIEVVDQVKRR
jgi:hypothetical protein